MTELDDVDKILKDSRNLYFQGLTTLNEGNKLLHDGIYRYPNNTSLRLALAAQLASTGGFQDSIELYKSVLQISPNDPYALTGLGSIYFELGKFSESLQLAKNSLNVRELPETKILLCRLFLMQGNFDEVKNILAEILRKDPNNEEANLLRQRLQHIQARDDQPGSL